MGAARTLIFDVNETLLDIDTLRPLFADTFGDAAVLRTWFGELVMYSMTLTVTGRYVDFFSLGQTVLRMLAEIRGVEITDEHHAALTAGLSNMLAHPDVAPGLQRLRENGYRLVTLTNSPHRSGRPSPLDNAGIAEFFEQQYSVHESGVYKPSARLYRGVADDLGVAPGECMMVAAHAWDTIGAGSAGLQSALITRPGNAVLRADGIPQPDLVAADIVEFAALLESA